MPKQTSKLQAGKKATKLKLVDKFIKTRCSKINTELVSLKIYKTNFKIYFKKMYKFTYIFTYKIINNYITCKSLLKISKCKR